MKTDAYIKKLGPDEINRRFAEVEKVIETKPTPDELVDAVMDPLGASEDIKLACNILMLETVMNERRAMNREINNESLQAFGIRFVGPN